jgi:hypothetical protein
MIFRKRVVHLANLALLWLVWIYGSREGYHSPGEKKDAKLRWPKLEYFLLIWSLAAGIVFFAVMSAPAGELDTIWVRIYDGSGNGHDHTRAIALGSSGNVYVTGESEGTLTGHDYATIKYYANGDTAWVRRYNAPDSSHDYAVDLAVDASGNVYVTGSSYGGSGTLDDCATIKYDPDGMELWVKRYNGPASLRDRSTAIALDGFGNVYVTGYSFQDFSTGFDYVTMKYDPEGNRLWVRTYDGPANSQDYAYAIGVDESNYVYVTGASPGGTSGDDYATIKYDSEGNQLWVKRYDGPAGGNDRAKDIIIDGSGNVCVTGYSYGDATDDDYATIKYDSLGNQLWVKRYDGASGGRDRASAMGVDASGQVYVTGTSHDSEGYDDYATVKYDPDGIELWVRRYNGTADQDDSASAIAVDAKGNVFVTGTSYGMETSEDWATLTYSPQGTEDWVERYDGPSGKSDEASDMAVDDSGYVYVTGIGDSEASKDKGGHDATSSGDYVTIKYVYLDPDFTVEVSPDGNTLCAGDSVTYQISLVSIDGFDSPCTLQISGLPPEVGWEFVPPQVVPPGNAILKLQAADSITSGTHLLTITASGEGKIRIDSTYLTTSNPPLLIVPDEKTFRTSRECTLLVTAIDEDIFDTLSLSTPFERGSFQQTDSLGGSASGLFIWTPEPADTLGSPYQLTFEVSDRHCETQSKTTILEVVSNYHPLFDDCPPPQIAWLGDTVSFTVSASDEDAGDMLTLYKISLFGDFPNGTQGAGSVSAEFSWIPEIADTQATHYAEFLVTDQLQARDTCMVPIEVRKSHPPQLSLDPPFSDTTIYEGQTLQFGISAEDPDEDPIILDALDVPSNASFTDSGNGSGSFTFTPDFTQADTYRVTFIATDTWALTDTQMCTIVVLNLNRPPEMELPFSDTTIYQKDTLEFSISAEDPDEDPLSFYAHNLPEGAWLDPVTAVSHWIPGWDQVGIFDSVLFEASDGMLADSDYVKITVRNRTLEILEHHPGPNEEDVLIDSDISVTLSEPIDFPTVDSNSFVIKSNKDGILKGVYIYTEGELLLGFSLPSDSMFGTLDTITVTLSTSIKDLADSGMAQPYSWEFYTGRGVYPGNTNNDTTVDERDILPLGFFWGETGPPREEKHQNIDWSIKPVHVRDPEEPNIKWDPASAVYADADGNGIVDAQDICAVADNWESKISTLPQDFQNWAELNRGHHQQNISIYETIYHALLNCSESEGKTQIRNFLEEILEEKNTPGRFEVHQNYPNPFNATTIIRYSLPRDSRVEICLYNILGQKVRILVNEYQTSGYRRIDWDGKDDRGVEVGSGIYFYQVKAGDFSCTRKLLLLK